MWVTNSYIYTFRLSILRTVTVQRSRGMLKSGDIYTIESSHNVWALSLRKDVVLTPTNTCNPTIFRVCGLPICGVDMWDFQPRVPRLGRISLSPSLVGSKLDLSRTRSYRVWYSLLGCSWTWLYNGFDFLALLFYICVVGSNNIASLQPHLPNPRLGELQVLNLTSFRVATIRFS